MEAGIAVAPEFEAPTKESSFVTDADIEAEFEMVADEATQDLAAMLNASEEE